MLCSGIAYFILARILIGVHGDNSVLANAVGSDFKGLLSIALYLSAIPLAFVNQWISVGIYVSVAAMWLVPDRRIEDRLNA